MDGRITVQSKIGIGTKITVYINQEIVVKTIHDHISLEEEKKYGTNLEECFMGNNQKILIVDDDPINLKIITKLLSNYNLSVESVATGLECIDRVLSGNTYDLIFLDQMMPEMSGKYTFENLKKIMGFSTPVIAISTNENVDIKNECLELGFADYLEQPMNKLELEKELIKFLGVTKVDSNSSNEEVVENISASDYLKGEGADIDKSLELLGDMDTYYDTANDFSVEVVDKLKNIEEYKNSNDMPNYAILVHSLKSDAKYLGFTKLAELALNHELESKQNNSVYVNDNYEELMKEANRVVDVIKNYLDKWRQ